MSYILDALKKSEQRRSQGKSPDLLSVQTAPATQPRRSAWPYAIVMLLIVNAAALWWWGRHERSVTPAPPSQQTTSSPAASPTPSTEKIAPARADSAAAPPETRTAEAASSRPPTVASPMPVVKPNPPPAVPAQSAETTRTQASVSEEDVDVGETPVAAPIPAPVKAAAATSATAAAPPAVRARPAEPVPALPAQPRPVVAPETYTEDGTISDETAQAEGEAAPPPTQPVANPEHGGTQHMQPQAAAVEPEVMAMTDLPVDVQQKLPMFKVTVHRYTADPAKRLVVIDGKTWRNGDELTPELKLESITAEGMILSFRGYRFRRGVH